MQSLCHKTIQPHHASSFVVAHFPGWAEISQVPKIRMDAFLKEIVANKLTRQVSQEHFFYTLPSLAGILCIPYANLKPVQPYMKKTIMIHS